MAQKDMSDTVKGLGAWADIKAKQSTFRYISLLNNHLAIYHVHCIQGFSDDVTSFTIFSKPASSQWCFS